MQIFPAIKDCDIVEAIGLKGETLRQVIDDFSEWFGGTDYYWVSLKNSHNFDTLPSEVKAWLKENPPADHFVILRDK